MRARMVVLLLVSVSAAGLLFSQSGSAAADDGVRVATCAFTASVAGDAEHEYVGSKKCKMCHKDQYKSWEETSHAKAFELLKPGNASEAKEKFKLDPAKDYSTDESCVGCHTVGFGKKGGYAFPDPADEKAVKKMAKLAGVGCESCHGPGKDYNVLKKDIKKEKRSYKFEELAALGMNKIEESVCTTCHNEKSATYDADNAFDFSKRLENPKGMHTHWELKQREG